MCLERREEKRRCLFTLRLSARYSVHSVYLVETCLSGGRKTGTDSPVLYRILSFIQRNVNPRSRSFHSRNANISRSRHQYFQLHENPRDAGADVNILESLKHFIRVSPRGREILYKGMNKLTYMTNAPLQNDPSDNLDACDRRDHRLFDYCTQGIVLSRVCREKRQRVYFLSDNLIPRDT